MYWINIGVCDSVSTMGSLKHSPVKFITTPEQRKVAVELADEWVELDDALLERLHAAQRTKGVTLSVLMAGRSDVPHGMNVARAAAILSGRAKRARRSHVNFLLWV